MLCREANLGGMLSVSVTRVGGVGGRAHWSGWERGVEGAGGERERQGGWVDID